MNIRKRNSDPEYIDGETQEEDKAEAQVEKETPSHRFFVQGAKINTDEIPLAGDSVPKPSALLIIRLIVTAMLIILSTQLKVSDTARVAMLVVAAVIVGYDVAARALSDLREGYFTRESFPVIVSVILAFFIGKGIEGTIALIILQLVWILRSYAIFETRNRILSKISDFDSDTDVENSESNIKNTNNAWESIKKGYGEFTETERKITNGTKFFVPVVLIVAAFLLALLPLKFNLSFPESLGRVATIIAIASPLGSLLCVPLTYLSGMVAAEKMGILFKSSTVVDKVAVTKAVVFDKVGTVTDGHFTGAEIKSDKMDSGTFLKVADYAAAGSKDPLLRAVFLSYGENKQREPAEDRVEYPGRGVSATVDGIKILLGTQQFLAENSVVLPTFDAKGRTLYMAVNNVYAGCILLSDNVSPDIHDTIRALSEIGVDRIAMVSSDGRETDRPVANKLGITEYFAECSPSDKASNIFELKKRIDDKGTVAYVAGVDSNPEPFGAADIGIALSAIDADIAITDGDVVSVPKAVLLSRKTRNFIYLEMLISVVSKLILIVLAALGLAPIWFGLTIDSCVSLALVIDCLSKARMEKEETGELQEIEI